jgi:biotin carboxyl carrier protein
MQWHKVVLKEDGREVEVLIAIEREGVYRVRVENREYIVEVRPKMAIAAHAPSLRTAPNEFLITSEVPGRVVRVFVNEGDVVKEGDVIAIIESMKMEIEITAPKHGIVEKVYVSRGSFIKEGEPLVKIRLLMENETKDANTKAEQ